MNSFQQDIHRVSLAISKLNFLKMNKKKAMTLIYDKYDEIKKIVYKLDIYYFKTKACIMKI